MRLLSTLDLLVLIAYFAGVVAIGLMLGGKAQTMREYFKGRGGFAWIPVLLSFFATAISAVTFVGKPGDAFGASIWTLLQWPGAMLGCIVVAYLFAAEFHKRGVVSIYEYLGERFGPLTHRTASLYFLVTQVLAASIRITLIGLILAKILGYSTSPVQLATGNVRDAGALIERLRDGTDPVTVYIRERLTPRAKAILSAYDGKGLVPITDQKTLVANLNSLISDPALYNPERFAHVDLSPAAVALAQRADSVRDQQLRNTLLLFDAFPGLLGRTSFWGILFACVVLNTVVSLVFSFFGGIKSVIWTDVAQFVIFIVGAITALSVVVSDVPGGVATIWHDARNTPNPIPFGGLSQPVLDGEGRPLRDPTTGKPILQPVVTHDKVFFRGVTWSQFLWVFLMVSFFAFFQVMASYGTDQNMMQRLLTTKAAGDARKSLIWTGLLDVPISLIFLFIGLAIYSFTLHFPDRLVIPTNDMAFPEFIMVMMPSGLRGLLIASIFAAAVSSASSSINSLASSAMTDLYRPLRPGRSETHYLRTSRWMMVVMCFALSASAIGLGRIWAGLESPDNFIWFVFRVTSFTFPPLLGVFLLGLLFRRGSDGLNMVGMLGSTLLLGGLTWIEYAGKAARAANVPFMLDFLIIDWRWFLMLGTLVTLAIGALGTGKARTA